MWRFKVAFDINVCEVCERSDWEAAVMKAKPHVDVEPGHEMNCAISPRNCDLFQGVKHEDSGRSNEESCRRVQVTVKLPGVPNHSGWVDQ